MGLLNTLENLVKGKAGEAGVEDPTSAFEKLAQTTPKNTLAEGISHAFNSSQTPPFEQMVSGLFGQSDPNQKAGMLNNILASLGSGGITQALGAAGATGALTSVLSRGSVTPQQAQQVSPQTVQVLAQQAAKKDPSIVDAAAGFYAQHPTLVKTLGAGALALLLSKISSAKR